MRINRILGSLLATLALNPVLHAQVTRQITDVKSEVGGRSQLDDSGMVVYTITSADEFGTNAPHAFQVVRWNAATGEGEQVTSFTDGVGWTSQSVSVSDDGQWLAFLSPGNLNGFNHDESVELFTMRSSRSELSQVTSDAAPAAGTVFSAVLSGAANRIAFVANTDPVGQNSGSLPQLFVVGRTGGAVTQLTHLTFEEDLQSFRYSISDDGEQLVFASRADLVPGGNPDGGYEVFGITADGTGLRQFTSGGAAGSPRDSMRPSICGDGSKVVFDSNAPLTGPNPLGLRHVFIVNWNGTGMARLSQTPPLATLANAYSPSITDDGGSVFYSHDVTHAVLNPDGNREIFRVLSNGTGRTALTSTMTAVSNDDPVVSGTGNRVAYVRDGRRRVMDGAGANDLPLGPPPPPEGSVVPFRAVDVTPDGSRIVFEHGGQIHRIQSDGTDPLPLTAFSGGTAEDPSISGDGMTVTFSSTADPLGLNATRRDQVFAVQADGTGLRQLTGGDSYEERSITPVIALDGNYVVFQSSANPSGQNSDYRPELFRIRPDGTDVLQLTNDDDDGYKYPRVDQAGVWVVYQSATDVDGLNPDGSVEIFRVRTDGTGLQRLTAHSGHDSTTPDISGSGNRIVYTSTSDPLGTNGDHNAEVFLFEVMTAATAQLTSTTGGDCRHPRISRNGEYVYFTSAAPLFEANPNGAIDGYRVSVTTGVVERVGALRRGPSTLGSNRYRDDHIATDATGNLGVLGGARGDWSGENPDYDWELWVSDQAQPSRIYPSRSSPTVVSWDPEPRPRRYDVVRGQVANLSLLGGSIGLGAVSCLEDDSPDTSTGPDFPDPDDPVPGEVFFYLHRGTQGVNDGPGSYGFGSNGLERFPGSGGCDP